MIRHLVSTNRKLTWRRRPHHFSTAASIDARVPQAPSKSETFEIPKRSDIIHNLRTEKEFDLLVIGGGATGAGCLFP